MKKLLLIAAAFISANAFAQRNIDWATTNIIKPDSLQSGTGGTPIHLEFEMTNMGPDTLLAGDTVIWQFGITNTNPRIYYPSPTQYMIAIASRDYNPNDTMIISANLTTNLGPSVSINIVVRVESYVLNAGSLVSETPASPNSQKLNNGIDKSIVWWNMQHWPVGLSEELSKATTMVYPNPVSDKLFFETTYGKAKNITIIDITGKEVAKINTSEFNTEVDVTRFNKGFYFYEIQTEEGATLKSGKFNVQ